jgi:tRNA threonylcarbamoyladenosine biosynthesis protein TsaB
MLAAESIALRHGHGEALMPMVDRVMAEAALLPHELDIVAAAIGPGGFTGIRVGLAAARGIAAATGARLIGVTGFAAAAHSLRRSHLAPDSLLVALDSRREDLYVQLFALDSVAPLATAQAVLPDHLADYVRAHPVGASLLIAGDAAETAAVALQGHLDFNVVPDSIPDALGVAAAALEQARSVPADEPVRPLYLRPPDVTLPRPRETAAIPPR